MGFPHVRLNQITLARFLLTMSDILIKNATILKQAGQINTKQSILIHDGHIQQVVIFPALLNSRVRLSTEPAAFTFRD